MSTDKSHPAMGPATEAEPDQPETPAEAPVETPPLRILKIASCSSLSGRSTLTYHIGVSSITGEIQLRLFHNTAKGYFSKDWVSMALMELLLTQTSSFGSGDVQRFFFQGKSANCGGFVLAALRHEGLIRAIPGSLRSYERRDSSAWQQEIEALIESGVSLSELQAPEVAPAAPSKKARKAKKKEEGA